jgi:hypothetical protein
MLMPTGSKKKRGAEMLEFVKLWVSREERNVRK